MITKLVLHLRPDLKASAEEPKKTVEPDIESDEWETDTNTEESDTDKYKDKWEPFLKKGDIWRFVKKAENDIFILEKANGDENFGKVFEIPKCEKSEKTEDELTFSVNLYLPQSKTAPLKKGKLTDYGDRYILLSIKDGKKINVDGFEISSVVAKIWLGVDLMKQSKTSVEIFPNEDENLPYFIGKIDEYSKVTDTLFLYDEKGGIFVSESGCPNNLYAIKSTEIGVLEELNKLTPGDVFYLDTSSLEEEVVEMFIKGWNDDQYILERERIVRQPPFNMRRYFFWRTSFSATQEGKIRIRKIEK